MIEEREDLYGQDAVMTDGEDPDESDPVRWYEKLFAGVCVILLAVPWLIGVATLWREWVAPLINR